MLRVSDLVVDRGGHTVLDKISLRVAVGERVAIHGPSGCGKSTLLHAIAGLVPVTAGSIWVDGKEVTSVPAHRRGIGLVFQDDQLFPQFDVGDNVSYALRVRRVARSERRRVAAEWLERVDLGGFAQRSVASLSGGEARRVALARTLAAEPRLVLLDEPLTGIDAHLRDRLLNDLRNLFHSLATTVVHVTHDRSEGMSLCHRSIEFADLAS